MFSSGLVLACLTQDLFGKTHLFGDEKGVAQSRRTINQGISGFQGLLVKFNGHILHIGMEVPVDLEAIEVRGHDHRTSPRPQLIQKGHGQCASFGSVGSYTQFIEQDKGSRPCLFQNLIQVNQVTGERTEILPNILFIADQSKDILKDPHLASLGGRNGKPALGHEGQQPQGL